jgi:hypothetical protein
MMLAERICHELELEPSELTTRARLAGWTPTRFRSETDNPGSGWQERFREAVTAAVARAADDALAILLRGGPVAVLQVAQRGVDLLELVKEPKLRAFVREFDPTKHGGRILTAPTGVGKTVSCVALLRRLVEWRILMGGARAWITDDVSSSARPLFRWVRAYDLPNARLEHSFGEGEADLVRAASTAEFLFLDDLGWESRRAGADDVVMEVLGARYDAGRITIATTGMPTKQLVDRYGEAVVRRIVESGGMPGKVLDLWPRPEP